MGEDQGREDHVSKEQIKTAESQREDIIHQLRISEYHPY